MPSSLLILVLSCRFSDCFSNSDDAEGGESDAARPPTSLNDGTADWLTDLGKASKLRRGQAGKRNMIGREREGLYDPPTPSPPSEICDPLTFVCLWATAQRQP